MTTIFYTQCRKLDFSQFKRGLSILPVEFQKRILKYKRWQDSHASLYGKLLLKEGLTRMGVGRSINEMKTTKFGKPCFLNGSFSFNISHSHNYILCAISCEEQKNLGIDVEKIKPIRLVDFENIWSSNEKDQIVNAESFYDYWTRKEAIVKAVGMGMYFPLNKIDVSQLKVNCQGETLFLRKINVDPDYVVHLASSAELDDVQLEYLSFHYN